MVEITSHTERFVREIYESTVMDFSKMPGEGIIEFACMWLHATINSEEITGSPDLSNMLIDLTNHLAKPQPQLEPTNDDASCKIAKCDDSG